MSGSTSWWHELNAWVVRRVERQPTVDDAVRNCVISADWRSHIDNSFDQLGLFHLRHSLVAPQELAGVHELPVFQRQWSAGELPAALGLLATANIGEESIAESWSVGKARSRPIPCAI